MIQLSRPVTQPKPRLRNCSAVSLDRDGTNNVKAPDGQYVTSPIEISLIPGTAAAISKLNAAAVRVVLVTNQRWLCGSACDLAGYARVHARLAELLAADGAHLDTAYDCPHACGSCDCRKPAPGMLRRAAREHRLSLGAAVMIGDGKTDIAVGRAAGTVTILLRAGQHITSRNADFVVDDLAEAVRLVLGDDELPLAVIDPSKASEKALRGVTETALPCYCCGPHTKFDVSGTDESRFVTTTLRQTISEAAPATRRQPTKSLSAPYRAGGS